MIAITSGVVVATAFAAGLALSLTSATQTPEAALSLLAESQRAEDTTLVSAEQFAVDPASVRFLGEDQGTTFWAAVDESSQVCVVVMLPDRSGGSGCRPVATFASQGTTLGLFSGEESGIRITLLPDSAVVSGDLGPWQRVGDNLVWAHPEAVDDDHPVELARAGGGAPFVLGS